MIADLRESKNSSLCGHPISFGKRVNFVLFRRSCEVWEQGVCILYGAVLVCDVFEPHGSGLLLPPANAVSAQEGCFDCLTASSETISTPTPSLHPNPHCSVPRWHSPRRHLLRQRPSVRVPLSEDRDSVFVSARAPLVCAAFLFRADFDECGWW